MNNSTKHFLTLYFYIFVIKYFKNETFGDNFFLFVACADWGEADGRFLFILSMHNNPFFLGGDIYVLSVLFVAL